MIERYAAVADGNRTVVAFRPHRTKKGHWVWRRHHDVTPSLTHEQIDAMGFGRLPTESLHNTRLTENETIRAMAHPETVFPQEYEGEGLS